ncbi:hypothetical protein [Flavobacterium sp. K5-23]|uniref:hypothetical protein n=1 Tax=Flavobacterium sp. K5-23 TaxID=2746225 RepID=UPI00200D3CC1|nr:hypothetical protein [Flavobacterium sp. K5-23]UQD56859.1 hypothetical protein FLAK523_10825 [Flavobacterium sp. K5-23]
MQLKKETFIGIDNHFDDFNFFYKEYYENGLLKSKQTFGYLSEFEYTEDGKKLVEKIKSDNGGGDNFFKDEYKYEGLTTRIFRYKTGYSDLNDQFVSVYPYQNLGEPRVGQLPIYPLSELLSIEELVFNENKEIISQKKTDLKNNSFSEEKRVLDDLGNLINRVYSINNKIQSNFTYKYKDNVLESILVNNAITYFNYNDDGNIIEINCFEIIDDLEVFYSNTVLEYLDNRLIGVSFNASNEDGFSFDDELGFSGWESLFNKERKSTLRMDCLLNPYYDYNQKKYEVKFIYGLNNEIKQSTVINSQNNWKEELDSEGYEKTMLFEEKTEENRFFIYKYNENLLINKNSENYMIKNNPIEYIDGFIIKDNQIEHLFTHKFAYYE